jgi:AbrB family looped-hinge helix DNA binding protein
MDIEITKLGERGQIVIPLEFREELHLRKGEKFIVARSDNKIILQQMSKLKAKTIEQLREDFVDMKIAEDRLEEIEQGKSVAQTKEKFLEEMEQWVNE